MEILSMILGYLPYIIISLILIGGVIALVINSRKSVKQWLLLAVCAAEKELGSGTGSLKLRTCYESFIKYFPMFSKFVTFEVFSKWVDEALVQMKKMLETNKKVEEYIKGDE